MHTAHEIGAVERELMRRSVDVPTEEDSYGAKEVKNVNEPRNYHFKPNPNLPTHYSPALRNHENFSYDGGALQGPRHGQNPQQGYQQPPRFQQQHQGGEGRNDYQGQRRTHHLKNKCCSSWGTTRDYYTSMNRNCLTWKLSSLILKFFRKIQVPR